MATLWTDEQRAAIENRGGTLLVSAAAGSGKTAVLVERVLRRLTDTAQPADIDRFLMVTYTNAAAAELRGKIADALTARLAQTPDDRRLRRQLFLIHRAQITTVHAFCLSLVREQFARLGLSPDFRVADPSEMRILMDETLDALLEDAYEAAESGGETGDFPALAELLQAGRDDRRLHDVLQETYEKLQSHPDPAAFLTQMRAACEVSPAEPANTPHGQVLLAEARRAAQYARSCIRQAMDEMQSDETVREAYLPAFTSDENQITTLLAALQSGSWDTAVAAAQHCSLDRLHAVRGYEDKAFLEHLKARRDEWRRIQKQITDHLLCITAAEAAEEQKMVAPAMRALTDMVQQFSERFAAEKRRRNLVDFNDLEHFTIHLLYENAAPTPFAQTLSDRFDEVLVDEYQDTNAVQDAIFRAASDDGRRLFMVGDVKQSIYSFRLANPRIFLEKYLSFPDADKARADGPRRVVLSRNFRSRTQVLDAVNTVFSAVMSRDVGDLDYDEREMLYPGLTAARPNDPRYRTEICVVDTSDAEEDAPDKTETEAAVVARRLHKLLREGLPVFDKALGRERPLQPSDCAVLLRSVRHKAAVYAKALEQKGIPAVTTESTGLLSSTEVRTVLSLLHVIDNPRQDVELIGALRSPLIGFTEEQLAQIRLCRADGCFFEALTAAAAEGAPDSIRQPAAAFLHKLSDWRLLSADLPLCELLQALYDETGALGIYGAQPNGAQRQKNLLTFFERVRNYEAQGYRGLFHFLHMVRCMMDNEQDFPAGAPAAGGAVRILSIHKSKGLEFPVVCLADCTRRFNESDTRQPILMHPSLGLGPKCRDTVRGIQYPTLRRLAIAVQTRREQLSEEMRILYVGMTRAREKLIVTCASGTAAPSLRKWASLGVPLPPYALGTARTSALWLLAPLLRCAGAQQLRDLAGITLVPDPSLPDCFAFQCVSGLPPEPTADEPQPVCEAAPQTVPPSIIPYPEPYLCNLPAKITATGLKQGFKAEEAAEGTPKPRAKPMRRPFFDQALRGLTPAERGTAHHLFLQFADFSVCETAGGVHRERLRMRERHILSPEQADAVQEAKISAFFKSDFYHTVVKAHPVRREFKFSVLVPAGRFFPDAMDSTAQVLLQGVIDCLIETPEGAVILDFKTDRVSAAGAQARAARYQTQMDAYALAAETIFARPVVRKTVFFLSPSVYADL